MEQKITDDIETVRSDSDALRGSIEPVREDKIRGEDVQDDAFAILDNHDALRRLCEWEYSQRHDDSRSVAEIVTALVNDGTLAEQDAEAFMDFWEDAYWLVDAVEVPMKNLVGYQHHWSAVDLAPSPDDPTLFEYELRWGVDSLIDAEIPAARIMRRSVVELDTISSYTKAWVEDDGIDDEMVAYMVEAYDTDWVVEGLRAIATQFETVQNAVGRPTMTSDPEIEVSWDAPSPKENVVGTLKIRPPGSIEDGRSDRDDDPAIGFQ